MVVFKVLIIMGKRRSAWCADSEWTAMFCCFSFHSPNYRQFFWCFLVRLFVDVRCSLSGSEKERGIVYWTYSFLLFYTANLSCHKNILNFWVTCTKNRKTSNRVFDFVSSWQVSKMHILFFERTNHSLDKMASPSTKQIAYLCMQTIYTMWFGGTLWVVK